MSGRQLCIGLMLCATLLVASAVAQDGKNELGGIAGSTIVSPQSITGLSGPGSVIAAGEGPSFVIEYSRRVYVAEVYALSAEGIFAYNYDQDLNAGAYPNAVVPADVKQFFVTPAVRVNLFPTTALSPFVSFGGGFARITQASTLLFGGSNPGKTTTSGVVEGGIGFDLRAWRKLFVRPEFRDFWAGQPDFPLAPTGRTRRHNYFVGIGAFWRF